jgi:hypothetical protein
MREQVRSNVGAWVTIGLVCCFVVWVTYSWIHAFATCNGHVVKNVFDFPVCVR